MEDKLKIEDISRILANPFYCINISENMVGEHEPLISEEDWIKAGVKSIKEDGDGGEKYLKHLLENLKGNFV
jgi:hypothetical protein